MKNYWVTKIFELLPNTLDKLSNDFINTMVTKMLEEMKDF